jgi:hypothetical protein
MTSSMSDDPFSRRDTSTNVAVLSCIKLGQLCNAPANNYSMSQINITIISTVIVPLEGLCNAKWRLSQSMLRIEPFKRAFDCQLSYDMLLF